MAALHQDEQHVAYTRTVVACSQGFLVVIVLGADEHYHGLGFLLLPV